MQKIKAVIFDFDGTLANTIPLCIEAFRQSVEPVIGRTLSDEEIVATFGPDEEGSIKKLAPDCYKEATADFMKHYETLHSMCPAPFDGIPEMLEVLKQKGVCTALVTGKGKDSTRLSLQRFGLTHYFDFIETGSPEGSRKGEAIGLILQALTHISKAEAIYVGDAPADVRDSRHAGIAIAGAAWADSTDADALKKAGPDEIFYTLPEFAAWLYQRL